MVENSQVFGSNEGERWNIKAVDRSIDLSTSLIITSEESYLVRLFETFQLQDHIVTSLSFISQTKLNIKQAFTRSCLR